MHPSRLARFALLLLPVACAPMTPPPSVTLPPAGQPAGAGDPTRAAILASSYVFNQPGTVAGDAAAAAEALGQLEYLAAEIASGPQWIDLDPLVAPMLAQGRAEARAAFGLDPAASPQRATDALYATATALRAGNREAAAAALAPVTGAEGAPATLQRLAALPHLPRAAAATARARMALEQRDRGNRRRFPF